MEMAMGIGREYGGLVFRFSILNQLLNTSPRLSGYCADRRWTQSCLQLRLHAANFVLALLLRRRAAARAQVDDVACEKRNDDSEQFDGQKKAHTANAPTLTPSGSSARGSRTTSKYSVFSKADWPSIAPTVRRVVRSISKVPIPSRALRRRRPGHLPRRSVRT